MRNLNLEKPNRLFKRNILISLTIFQTVQNSFNHFQLFFTLPLALCANLFLVSEVAVVPYLTIIPRVRIGDKRIDSLRGT